jgi:hypothetical protein
MHPRSGLFFSWRDARNGLAQILEQEWFADHEVDSGQRTPAGLKHFGVGGNHDDGLARVASFDRQSQFVPFHCRHGEVGDYQVELGFVEQREGVLSATSGFDGMSIECEHHFHRVANEGLIVDNQDSALWKRGRFHASLQPEKLSAKYRSYQLFLPQHTKNGRFIAYTRPNLSGISSDKFPLRPQGTAFVEKGKKATHLSWLRSRATGNDGGGRDAAFDHALGNRVAGQPGNIMNI